MKLKGGCDELGSTLHLGVPPALCVVQHLAGNAAALGLRGFRGAKQSDSAFLHSQATPGWQG